MRAPQLCGNATTIPVRNPAPLMSISPPRDTWREFVEQWIAGTHLALVSVNGFARLAGVEVLTAGLGELPPDLLEGAGAFEEGPPLAGVPPPAGATAPPGLVEARA